MYKRYFASEKLEEYSDKNAIKLQIIFILIQRELSTFWILKHLIYTRMSVYGHFGRDDVNLSLEKLDKVDLLKKYLEDVKMTNET